MEIYSKIMDGNTKYKWLVLVVCLASCGRTEASINPYQEPEQFGTEELCDNLDNDFDGEIDEDFTDSMGRYVHIDHCGACSNPSAARLTQPPFTQNPGHPRSTWH